MKHGNNAARRGLRETRSKLPSAAALSRYSRWILRRIGGPRVEVRVDYCRKLRTTLGRADETRRAIELNPHLLARHPEELVPTLLHELCHLVAGVGAGHGPRWKAWMEKLGLEPLPRHCLAVEPLQLRRRRWLWRCCGCGQHFERSHRGARRYACARCGGALRVAGPLT